MEANLRAVAFRGGGLLEFAELFDVIIAFSSSPAARDGAGAR